MSRYRWQAWVVTIAAAVLAAGCLALAAEGNAAGGIDWARAQSLMQKQNSGQTLTADEQAYLQQAREAYARGERPAAAGQPAQDTPDVKRAKELLQRANRGDKLSDEERTFIERVRKAGGPGQGSVAPPPKDHTGLVPLDQMTAQETYKGADGGLYGGGQNVPPPAHQQAAAKESAKIVPLDRDGKPAADGKIVLISIGMSNTTQEFSKFKELADRDPAKSPRVVIVDCAQGGQDAERWSQPGMPAWQQTAQRLRAAGVTPEQVQAAWVKHARIQPARYGEFPKHGEELKGHILASLNIARQKFPNLRVAYLSSRIYAAYATTGLNPEPYAYESAFVVRGLIRDQVRGRPELNYGAQAGDVKAPLLLWGPYLWGDGTTPRTSDGLVWLRDDLAGDGTHPSQTAGREKVAKLLLRFFTTDANAKGWFCGSAAK